MLPGIRSVLIAIIAALGLLIGAFGVVAAFRVAQESRSGSFQAEFAQRSRVLVAANREPRDSAPTETPAPLEANPVRPVVIENAPAIPPPVMAAVPEAELDTNEPPLPPWPPAVEAKSADPQAAAPMPAAVAAAPESQSAPVESPGVEPPMGGPLPDQAEATQTSPQPRRGVNRIAALKKAKQEMVRKAKQEAVAKERAARRARIARELKAVARKAAQARAKQQAAAPANEATFGSFGNSATNTWRTNTFGTGTFGR
jgi:hypothetical protein